MRSISRMLEWINQPTVHRLAATIGSRFDKPLQVGEERRESGDSPWAVKKTTSRKQLK